LLPIPTGMLLFGPVELHFIALFMFIAIGLADIWDGMLARRQGPTQFGAMLDPLADKIFILAIIVPFAEQGRAPVWFPAALLAREFLVTGLRTQMTLRDHAIKTSVLAKLKTSIQMAGFGMVFLNEAVPREIRTWVVGGIAAGAVLVLVLVAIRKRLRVSPFVWIPCCMLVLGFFIYVAFPKKDTSLAMLYIILAFTWGSGLDYVLGSLGVIRRTGLQRVDVARVVWTLGTVAVTSLLVVRPAFAFLVVILLTAEFLIGGIDNLRALSGTPSSNTAFVVRAVLSIAGAAAIHAAVVAEASHALTWAMISALTVIVVGNAIYEAITVRPLMSGKATTLAYTTEPPPRTASE
ncbi:MAG: CDP-alcohol phosphatidyltransferase family protein, partial [Pseudomonadota bacterium]